jgi:hypothetical protein
MATKKSPKTASSNDKPMLLRGFTEAEGAKLIDVAKERGFRSRTEYLNAAIRHDAGMKA